MLTCYARVGSRDRGAAARRPGLRTRRRRRDRRRLGFSTGKAAAYLDFALRAADRCRVFVARRAVLTAELRVIRARLQDERDGRPALGRSPKNGPGRPGAARRRRPLRQRHGDPGGRGPVWLTVYNPTAPRGNGVVAASGREALADCAGSSVSRRRGDDSCRRADARVCHLRPADGAHARRRDAGIASPGRDDDVACRPWISLPSGSCRKH